MKTSKLSTVTLIAAVSCIAACGSEDSTSKDSEIDSRIAVNDFQEEFINGGEGVGMIQVTISEDKLHQIEKIEAVQTIIPVQGQSFRFMYQESKGYPSDISDNWSSHSPNYEQHDDLGYQYIFDSTQKTWVKNSNSRKFVENKNDGSTVFSEAFSGLDKTIVNLDYSSSIWGGIC